MKMQSKEQLLVLLVKKGGDTEGWVQEVCTLLCLASSVTAQGNTDCDGKPGREDQNLRS